jgi:hypothetical protein
VAFADACLARLGDRAFFRIDGAGEMARAE